MKFSLLFILTLTFSQLFGQTDNQYKIDRDLISCMDSVQNQTTVGTTHCIVKATKKWDIELNKNYQKLLELLSDIQKEKLINSQREWIRFRDKEIDFSNQIYDDLQGTMWILPVAAEKKLNLTKQRALELAVYIVDLTFDQ